MRIVLARSAGFCYGVKRAVEMAEEAARNGGAVLLGPVIHNDHVVAGLTERGAALVHSVEEVPPGSAVILRSHGEARRVHEALAAKGCRIVDTACPNVQRIHRLVAEAEAAGRQPVIIGTPDHPEIVAIAGWCENPVTLPDARPWRTGWRSGRNGGKCPLRWCPRPHPPGKFGIPP